MIERIGRSPLGERGLKLLDWQINNNFTGRSPLGERGLKPF